MADKKEYPQTFLYNGLYRYTAQELPYALQRLVLKLLRLTPTLLQRLLRCWVLQFRLTCWVTLTPSHLYHLVKGSLTLLPQCVTICIATVKPLAYITLTSHPNKFKFFKKKK